MIKTFEDQIKSFSGPVGLVWYIAKRKPKFKNIDECRNSIFESLKVINQYDPMQLHGVKSDSQLLEIANSRCSSEFESDQKLSFEIRKGAIELKNSEECRCDIESDPDFYSWDLSLIN